jgi:hypothetical protein
MHACTYTHSAVVVVETSPRTRGIIGRIALNSGGWVNIPPTLEESVRTRARPGLARPGWAGSDGGAAGAGENPFAGDIFVVRQARRPGLLKNLSSGWIHAIFVDIRGGISAGWGVEGA